MKKDCSIMDFISSVIGNWNILSVYFLFYFSTLKLVHDLPIYKAGGKRKKGVA